MSTLARLFSTEHRYSGLEQSIKELGDTKMSDLPNTGRHVKKISRGLFARYVGRYFGRGSFTPVVHLMVGIGLLGYSWEYQHLSTFCCRQIAASLLEHQREHPEESH